MHMKGWTDTGILSTEFFYFDIQDTVINNSYLEKANNLIFLDNAINRANA